MFNGWLIANAVLLFLTLVVEALIGYPAWLHARIPHPVVWAGYAIGALDRRWNQSAYPFAKRRLLGCVAMVLVIGAAVVL
jgi:adenosylcobinamide-phosphate synthase